jgi:hypothetical protein
MLNSSSRMIAELFQGGAGRRKRGRRDRNDFKADLLHGVFLVLRVEA